MSDRAVRLSLTDLATAGVVIDWTEAVTIVREVSLQVARGEIPGVPSPHVIRLSSDGTIGIEGPVAAGGRSVVRAAQLLQSLLPGFDAARERRVPGALRLVVARALSALDLPPYPSLESFADALSRFAAPDPAASIGHLVASADATSAGPTRSAEPGVVVHARPPESTSLAADRGPEAGDGALPAPKLTISDIRRARRATGLTLAEIAARSRIPAPLLRELEWGYFRNWPAGHYGRTQLVRYARAAGLDDELVVNTVWPMLEEMAGQRSTALVRIHPAEPVRIAEGEIVDAESPSSVDSPSIEAVPSPHSRRNRALTVLAIPALLAIALLPAAWERYSSGTAAPPAVNTAKHRTTPDRATPQGSTPGSAGATMEVVQSAAGAESRPNPAPSAGGRAKPHRAAALTDDAAAFSPAFATTGSAMFYRATSGGDGPEVPADANSGGALLKVTSVVDGRANNFHARPSPDGTQIAFDSDRDGERAVYVADSTGHNVRKISGDGFAAIPSWSPDGKRLAFVRAEPDKPQVWNLWTIDLASRETKRLTSHASGQPWGASWFPDGRRIAYSHGNDLVVLNVDTGRPRVFHSPKPGHLLRTPAVSPDGRRVIFQVYGDGAWLLDLSDGSMLKVLSDASAEEYTWAPDGRRVAYHSRQSGDWGVWVMARR